MALQNKNGPRDTFQNEVLSLEKKYFSFLEEIICGEGFIADLLLIEKEIQENYPKYRDVWLLKNKIKVPAERLIRHHIYNRFHDLVKGIYPSPISSDLGIRVEDAVICIDAKTIDTHGNANDLASTEVEPNQTSFNNEKFPYIPAKSNLDSIDHYSRLPVLTFVIKIVYHDDNYSFKIERGEYPSIVLACIPNGELSHLFDYNIIDNFKTYDYYKATEGPKYQRVPLPRLQGTELEEYLHAFCEDERHFSRIHIDQYPNKIMFFDPATRITWWETTESKIPVIAPLKAGATARFNNKALECRFDEKNNEWKGYREYQLPDY